MTALIAVAALSLSSCGGGSAFGSKSGSSGSTPTQAVASVTVLTSAPQMPSNNSEPATITALVRDANNVVIQNAAVQFSTSSGLIAVTQAVTNADGQALATLSTPGDYATRTITVTAAVGNVTGTVPVDVVGTTLAMAPQSGSGNIVQGSAATYLLTLLDSGGDGIANQTIDVTSAKGNTLSAANLTTDVNGQATFTVTGTVSGTDTLTATAAGQTAQQSLVVSNQNFAMTTPAAGALIQLNTATPVSVTWTSSGAPVSGQTITFTTTRGSFGGAVSTTAPTNGSGVATVDVSSTTAGPAVITATGGTGSTGVTAQVAVTFVATVPASITVQASPDTIGTGAQSTITAVVRDAQNNLVEGQTVDFALTDVTGGAISTASAVTNTQGVAQTVYTASSTASATNGVQVAASVQSAPSIAGTVDLTVGGQTAFLSLGTGATISENSNKTQFIMPFSVQAVDARGNALPNVPISLTIHSSYPGDAGIPANLTAYFKGGWIVSGSDWVQTGTPGAGTVNPVTACLNEDLAENGILEPGEDTNGNGRLDPGNVATTSPGSVTTDSTGSAEFTVIYPEDHALWVRVTLTATATVAGTQNSASSIFVLPILASYITTTTSSPPGYVSPYGTVADCTSPH
ncbi:MAG TPA: Ig-like domain-containing protein [Steroidobacteraceae bacterium]|nr:Ig-like domain-containing protein [Steroidobacteraceae bacterium]